MPSEGSPQACRATELTGRTRPPSASASSGASRPPAPELRGSRCCAPSARPIPAQAVGALPCRALRLKACGLPAPGSTRRARAHFPLSGVKKMISSPFLPPKQPLPFGNGTASPSRLGAKGPGAGQPGTPLPPGGCGQPGPGSGRAVGAAYAPRRPQATRPPPGCIQPRSIAEGGGGRKRVSLPPGCRNHKPPEYIRIIIIERFPPTTPFLSPLKRGGGGRRGRKNKRGSRQADQCGAGEAPRPARQHPAGSRGRGREDERTLPSAEEAREKVCPLLFYLACLGIALSWVERQAPCNLLP